MKLRDPVPNSYIHVYVSDLYSPMIGPPIFVQHRYMNVEIGNEAACSFISGNTSIGSSLQCVVSRANYM